MHSIRGDTSSGVPDPEHGVVAQLEERPACNRKVRGSIPLDSTKPATSWRRMPT